jgi:hypothetical protein
MEKVTSPKIAKWVKWQELILKDVVWLHSSKQIYDDYISILRRNESVEKEGVLFHNWIVDNYVSFVAMAIRRQAETPKANNDDVISLGKLLSEIIESPGELTRAYFTSLYVHMPKGMADKHFTENAGAGDYIDPKMVEKDLEELLLATKKIEDLATLSIAHHTTKKKPELTFNEVNKCIDTIKKLTQKYVLLLTATWNVVDPVIDYWQGIFTRPWIHQD